MSKIVPAMIQSQMKVMRQNMENENKFWSKWPALDRGKHAPILAKYAPLYRQANPSATLEKMVEDLGPILHAAAGIAMQAQPNGGTPPTTPAARVPQSPFKPAMSGPAAIPSNEPENPWAALAEAPQDED